MKIFFKDDKINFVDDNNVFVGFDMHSQCCENFGWFITRTPKDKVSDNEYTKEELADYTFNTNYFKEVPGGDDDDGSIVRFCLINKMGKELFLHLYNFHNGYYGHGFDSEIGGVDWMSGSL